MSRFGFPTISKLLQLQLDNKLTAVDLVHACFDNIELYNAQLNAIVTLDKDTALQAAKQADDYRVQYQRLQGPLHGIPTAVKDIFAVKGMRSTSGTTHFSDFIPDKDDIFVQRQRDAGAIIIGKTNTPACAAGGITENSLFGLTKNPWDVTKTTGGSGGGGVAALMSGMVVYADGSDVGGSVRSPASWTNCIGFRPSSGRIPGEVGSLCDGNISTPGVLARSVDDVAIVVSACEGRYSECPFPYPEDSYVDVSDLNNLPKMLRVAWLPQFAGDQINDEIAHLFAAQKTIFEELELSPIETAVPFLDRYKDIYLDFNALTQVSGFPQPVLDELSAGGSITLNIDAHWQHCNALSSQRIIDVQRSHHELRVEINHFFDDYNIMVSPTHGELAYDVSDVNAASQFPWQDLFFAPQSGLPSVSIPMGFTSDGMPCGLMITGRHGEDQLVLQIANAVLSRREHIELTPDLSVLLDA